MFDTTLATILMILYSVRYFSKSVCNICISNCFRDTNIICFRFIEIGQVNSKCSSRTLWAHWLNIISSLITQSMMPTDWYHFHKFLRNSNQQNLQTERLQQTHFTFVCIFPILVCQDREYNFILLHRAQSHQNTMLQTMVIPDSWEI